MSYFGYKKQEDPNKSMIDWAGITSKISKEITTVADDRKKQRTDLATEQQKLISDTDVFDQNENPSYNQFLIGGGQDAAKKYTEIDNLMTSGQISVDQAKIMKQNVKDTWVGMKGTISALDAEYKKLMENPTAGNLAQAEALENIMNLDSKKVRYDGNSHGYLVEVDKEGNEIEGKRVSIRSLAKNSFKQFEAVDLSAETSKITKDVKAIEMFESATVSNKDPRLRPDYKTWLNASATRILDNDQKIASLLMEAYNVDSSVGSRVGKTRSITYNVITGYKNGVPTVESRTEEIGPIEMKMGENGRLNPVITEEMREIALEGAKSDIEMKLMAEKKKKYVDPRAYKKSTGEKVETDEVNMIDLFVVDGDFTGLKGFLSKNGNLAEVSDDNKNLFFTRKDGTMVTVDLTGSQAEVGRSIAALKDSSLAAEYTKNSKSSKTNNINSKGLEFRKAKFNVQTKLKEGAAKRLEGRIIKDMYGQTEVKAFDKEEYLSQIRTEAEGVLDPSSISINNKDEVIYTTPGTAIGTVLGKRGDNNVIIANLEKAAASDVKNTVTPENTTDQAPI